MFATPECSAPPQDAAAIAGPPRATEYSAIALALACAALALGPVRGAVAGAPCVCAMGATLLGLVADRSRSRMVSAIGELLVAFALLATAVAILTQGLLAQSDTVSAATMGMRVVSAAFAFAACLFGTSRALHRLGSGVE